MKILIPLDGSANAQRAFDYVVNNIAIWKDAPKLLLLNVQANLASGNVKLFINQETINDHYREQGEAALESACALLDSNGLSYQYHISVGASAVAIVQYAHEQCVDLIVMGRQGQSGLQTRLLGSVVNKVLHLAECPVMLVK